MTSPTATKLVLPSHIERRFWSHVQIDEGCLLWLGTTFPNGYGAFSYTLDGKKYRGLAHRLMFAILRQQPVQNVLHSCDVKLCVRIDHLSEGSQSENVQQAVDRGLFVPKVSRGEKHGRAKLTEEKVRVMRELRDMGASLRQLRVAFDTPHSTVCNIVSGRTWRHVDAG